MIQLARINLTAASLALLPAAAAAQNLDYATGDYQYVEQQGESETQTREEDRAVPRVIPERQDGAPVIFAPRPVAQPVATVEPDDYADIPPGPAEQGEARLAAGEVLPEKTLLYAYPAIYQHPARAAGATRVIYRARETVPQAYGYIYQEAEPPVPAGGRLVQFDREAWLAECSRRIAPRAGGDGDDEIAADRDHPRHIEPTLDDKSRQSCETYLDGYMQSAQTGGLHGQYSQSGQYMLVPVTVLVPQRAVYSDGTPVSR
ncbi:MAG: hypothetical protein WC692_03385 [Erythrobacter sp.]|jgi:hypothetical protein